MDPNELLNEFIAGGKAAADDVLKSSAAIGRSMLTSLEIAQRAGRELLSGNLDAEGAGRVAQRGFDQLKSAAVAQGNLVASGLTDWLSSSFKVLLKFLPIPKIG